MSDDAPKTQRTRGTVERWLRDHGGGIIASMVLGICSAAVASGATVMRAMSEQTTVNKSLLEAIESIKANQASLAIRIDGLDKNGTEYGRLRLVDLQAEDRSLNAQAAALRAAVDEIKADQKSVARSLSDLNVSVGVLLDRTKPKQ